MDLRGMLNDGPAASTPSKPPPPQIQHPPQPSMPSTPVQTNSYQPFRDYGQTQPSPSRPMSLDHSLQQLPPSAYASPPPYQGASGPYPNRPAPPPPPPPLQRISPNDLRSPSVGSGPGPSPYRQTPTSSISAASVGYPFPQQTPTSPVQRHQYPPHQAAYHRDSFPQPSVPGGMTGPPGGVSYMQPQQVPQTPPVVTPGGHPYPPHQRSQSTHSTPTPTSAQSQPGQQYGAPFIQGSPVATHHNLPQMDPQQRQPSQPPTPVAAPLSRPAQTMSFGQPPSPYQQRMSTTATYPHPPPLQRSPPAPPPPSLPRHSSSTSIYDPLGQDPLRRSQSHGDRDRSISVSPKTRIPSLPTSAGRPGSLASVSAPDSDPRHAHIHSASAIPGAMTVVDQDRERAHTPAKRKLDDRELRPDELEKRDLRPPPFDHTNGRSIARGAEAIHPSQHLQPSTFSAPRKKRKVHAIPPVWAQKLQGQRPTHSNYSLYKPVPSHQHGAAQINGKPDGMPSRHTSPEDSRRAMPAPQHPPAAPPAPAPPIPTPVQEESLLGPWEPSITNEIPLTDTSRAVADFLFRYVIGNEDFNQIQSRGVHFEIEAKLGTLIDKNDGQPLRFPIRTECILSDEGEWSNRLGFKSSMSESQHKAFNEFLNEMVKQAHQDNKDRPRPRVPIRYKHRREIDKFYELPAHIRDQTLPPCVTGPMQARGHSAKVRVTYDQKTNEVLAKIVKVRIADLSMHIPSCPLDCRISINLEMDWGGGMEELEQMSAQSTRPSQPSRNKDRLSYNHSHYQIDLTQVTIMGPHQAKKEHELEVELNPDALIDQGKRTMNGQPNQYADLVDGFLNNIRVLARKANDFAA
ncbi:CYTH-like domain-containing protein [Cercophora newfieldiana]|uniref:mRNA-capping enzyme subunit beta n=1 Tax=Cercophora newfieldiana TaxID=92897 RepID=A0AA39YDI8_9PEZI|nr:CYTH-like domain-containing protein [Cercophora newfieldiana]